MGFFMKRNIDRQCIRAAVDALDAHAFRVSKSAPDRYQLAAILVRALTNDGISGFRPLALRRKAAAKAIGVGTTKLNSLIATGEIAAVKSGKCLLIPVAELEQYLARLPRAELSFAKPVSGLADD
jgi:excisionase family DNA binding protein